MATRVAHISTNGAQSTAQSTGGVRLQGARGVSSGRRHRRQLPLVVLGVLLLLGGALAFAETALHLQGREDVLVTANALGAGHVLDPSDLRPVTMAAGSSLALVPVGDEGDVLGRSLAVPLVAGAPLTEAELGAPPVVSAGSDTVALLLRPGGYPPDLAPGDRVAVVPVSATGSAIPPSGTTPVNATVLAISAAPAAVNGGNIVTLLVRASSADGVAALAAAGEASLVQQGVGS